MHLVPSRNISFGRWNDGISTWIGERTSLLSNSSGWLQTWEEQKSKSQKRGVYLSCISTGTVSEELFLTFYFDLFTWEHESETSETQHNITNHNRTKREDISHQTINVSLNSTQQRLSKFIPKQLRKGSWTLKCSKKCVRRDWSERAHYISIKHAPYVTQVHCWDIMHAAYVIGTSARNSRYIL